MVQDIRNQYTPVTRLSKSKGKIDVMIKVGTQYVQVTTTKKQEIYAGFRLSTTINDIFRLGDIEETTTSIQTEDDSAFGLRADSGKIIMYFTSPKKQEILQMIRSMKARQGKDSRTHKPVERLIRPQDVPGTLLNLALTNLSSHDHVLRLSSYNLLGALCKAFKFGSASRLVCTKGESTFHLLQECMNKGTVSNKIRCIRPPRCHALHCRHQQRARSYGASPHVRLPDRVLRRLGEFPRRPETP